jgi:hypothetical protein
MKTIRVEIGKKTYYLAFTVGAMFEIQDKHGGVKQFLETLDGHTRAGIDAICEATALLAEQGELTRRHFGYDNQDMLTPENVKLSLQPFEVAELITSIHNAISLGFSREVNTDNGDEDIGLTELEQSGQKKTS